MIRQSFESLHLSAKAGELSEWQQTQTGSLALLLLLDQLPRNMYRKTQQAYATDPQALLIAVAAINLGHDAKAAPQARGFYYLPFMHSESLALQECCVALYRNAGMDEKWAKHHREIIQNYGRFPHRNAILGRDNTSDEEGYLQQESSFAG